MDHLEFNRLFDQEFADPLIENGFAFVRRTKSLRYRSGTRDLWIKRISGKWPQPGVAQTAICFRHDFLRPVSSDDPGSDRLGLSDFPRKLNFEAFEGLLRPRLRYHPENTGRSLKSVFRHGDQHQAAVIERLQKMRKMVETRILPWANSLTEEGELSQITKFGEQAWCEKRWIDDYKAFLSKPSR